MLVALLATTAASRAQPSSDDALRRAARTGDLVAIRQHLQEGADPNARGSRGRTALLEAVAARQIAAATTLLQAGADVDARTATGRTALIEAAGMGDLSIVRLLIARAANLNAMERGWGSALEVAERLGRIEIAAELQRAGARGSGKSVGDRVCVRPWAGDGYCGDVIATSGVTVRIHITAMVGCEHGCAARPECSGGLPAGGAGGLRVGDEVSTVTWCLTHTGVER